MNVIGRIYAWFFVRIPKKFSIPFIVTLIWFNAIVYTRLMIFIDTL